MKNKLIQITNLSINEVLGNEIILPSLYFKTFDENAKNLKLNLNNEKEQEEMQHFISDEFNSINDYMNTTISSIETLSVATKIAKVAIKNNDVKSLEKIQNSMSTLEQELISLRDEIYKDPFTNTYNRKWIYKTLIDKDSKLKEKGIFVLINIKDFDYVKEEHNELIANNLLIFILNFLNKQLKKEGIKYQSVRFFHDTFLILVKDESRTSLNTLLLNIMEMMKNTTLKSKSGIVLQARFNFSTLEYRQNDNFQIILESLSQGLNE